MGDSDIGLLYLSLHNQLVRKVSVGRTISRKHFFSIIGRHFLVPRNLRGVIIKELEDRGLIKRKDRDKITVLGCDLNIERDTSKFFKRAGLF